MTIKKPMKAPETAETVATMPGGATIADRFKLDLTDPNAQKAQAGGGTVATVVAGFIALVVVGVLTFVLYQHWEFLQSA